VPVSSPLTRKLVFPFVPSVDHAVSTRQSYVMFASAFKCLYTLVHLGYLGLSTLFWTIGLTGYMRYFSCMGIGMYMVFHEKGPLLVFFIIHSNDGQFA